MLSEALVNVAGVEVARARAYEPTVHCFFAQSAYKADRSIYNQVQSGKGLYRRGDFIELLAHDDLYCAIAPNNEGDFHHVKEPYRTWPTWPLKGTILEGRDRPLETIPEPDFESMHALDFLKAGKPGMVTGRVGNEKDAAYFG